MKCPYCHGKGSRHVVDQALKLCLYCQGTGKIEPTHQEFIQNCTTEELVEEILALVDGGILDSWHEEHKEVDSWDDKGVVKLWLKEKKE